MWLWTGPELPAKMFRLFLFAIVVAGAAADLSARWAMFKTKFNKNYTKELEEARKGIWTENIKKIDEHNKLYAQGRTTSFLAENRFIDMTDSEFAAKMLGTRSKVRPTMGNSTRTNRKSLPASVDWRKKGYVTGVKNQMQCGSCWAFSATGAMEGQHMKSSGKLVSLSEQNLVDCVTKDSKCAGGSMQDAFQYVIDNKGIDTEESYPYFAMNGTCHFSSSSVGAKIGSFKNIEPNEAALQEATAEIGPISVGIFASSIQFRTYHHGVNYIPGCPSDPDLLDHGVLVVGYGTEDNQDYWMVKNSWGRYWGLNGYIKMARNRDNNCGIATDASYPIV